MNTHSLISHYKYMTNDQIQKAVEEKLLDSKIIAVSIALDNNQVRLTLDDGRAIYLDTGETELLS